MAPTALSVLGIVEDFVADRPPPVLPVRLPHLPLDGLAQVPETPIVVAKDVVRQLVAERVPDDPVVAVPVVRVRPQPQLDDLAPVAVQAQGARFVRRVRGRVHLGQHADAELVFAHAGFDAGVVAQALEESLRAGRVGEVAEGEDGVEGVGCLVLGFLPVAVAVGGDRFGGGVGGARRREGGELGRR